MYKKSKNKLVITSVIMIAILAVLAYLYSYTESTYLKTKKDYAKLLSESEILDLKISSTEKTNARLAEIRDIQQAIPNILPPEKIQSDIVAQILGNGDQTGIFIDSINFPTSDGENFALSQTEPLEGVSGVNKLPININFQSSFEQMILFIELLEKNRRISQIETISISPAGSDDDENVPASRLAISILLNLYVRS